jgi:hypothetical protein
MRPLRRPIKVERDVPLARVSAKRRAVAERLRAMLPSPVSGETTLVGGEPKEVIAIVSKARVEILSYAFHGCGAYSGVVLGRLVADRSLDANPSTMAAAVMRARAQRLVTYRRCSGCRSMNPPEWMTQECRHSCFQEAGGVF